MFIFIFMGSLLIPSPCMIKTGYSLAWQAYVIVRTDFAKAISMNSELSPILGYGFCILAGYTTHINSSAGYVNGHLRSCKLLVYYYSLLLDNILGANEGRVNT